MSNTEKVLSVEEREAVKALLFQLADDDFLFSYRASEWLGLAPHIEEDVASSSITQDTMGHSAMYYMLLENLGAGKADDLAHLRPAEERRNSVLTERVNGEGYYMDTPQYDWAYTVVRSYFYTQAKKVKIDSLRNSSYEPLAEVAIKVNMEIYYHLMHWRVWFEQLLSSTEDAKVRMTDAIKLVMADFGDVFSYGDQKEAIERFDIIATEEDLEENWILAITPMFEKLGNDLPVVPKNAERNGRNGEHTRDLVEAIATLSEVYRMDLSASW
ncbi:1,2-phenylacetyl-CoA epoxidase subunit PaaC [Sporosarcina limicola]|uniref:Ring-1,2-phenylacetyl-CoA epoxidase subunit PaaC n=1 Tax=Sporosarcina limicola TaxID=34101 RepID=A0A927MJY7_9BACL|nr:1,2-phenylacetyl-CoA epoxidase subunit PaaC [Sporosarcina limicola]MBE1555313.1 ring-1,2-phenylacetyl-CoA epoxidase subunit PaaC [Sporosarcina limicola]